MHTNASKSWASHASNRGGTGLNKGPVRVECGEVGEKLKACVPKRVWLQAPCTSVDPMQPAHQFLKRLGKCGISHKTYQLVNMVNSFRILQLLWILQGPNSRSQRKNTSGLKLAWRANTESLRYSHVWSACHRASVHNRCSKILGGPKEILFLWFISIHICCIQNWNWKHLLIHLHNNNKPVTH